MTRAEVERVLAWAHRIEVECKIIMPLLVEHDGPFTGGAGYVRRIERNAEKLSKYLPYDLAALSTLADLNVGPTEDAP